MHCEEATKCTWDSTIHLAGGRPIGESHMNAQRDGQDQGLAAVNL